MPYPSPTSGVGVAASLLVAGTANNGSTTPGFNDVVLSLSGTNGPTSFQLNPEIADVNGTPVKLGTAYTLSAVAASVTPGTLTLSQVAVNGVYTGTITGGGSNAFVGLAFEVAGFTNAANNGNFICTASSTTSLTLNNANSVAQTQAATANSPESVAIYTGTITGGGSNAYAGDTFEVTGFVAANNNGSFVAVASSATTLSLSNAAATAVTAAGTATSQETTTNLTYTVDGAASYASGTSNPSGSPEPVVSVSADGLITTNGVTGGSVVGVNFPTFNNASGTITAGGQSVPLNKVYAAINVTVVK